MTGIFDGPADSTPLEIDGQEALIPTWIASRSDLNNAEQANIAKATTWAFGHRWNVADLDQRWLMGLHHRMFRDVWRRAGHYRQKETNVGLVWHDISSAVSELVLDLDAQVHAGPAITWSADEIAVRFHHRLVAIHPFVNGNGRHARLASDVLVVALGEMRFDWGAGGHLAEKGTARDRYLSALRRADQEGDYSELLVFARSSEEPTRTAGA